MASKADRAADHANRIAPRGGLSTLERLKPVAEDVWIVDGEPIHVMGLEMPVRMTVIRLRSRQLWLYSPTPFSEGLKQVLEAIGPLGHIVAPNVVHWSFVEDWQRHVDAEA